MQPINLGDYILEAAEIMAPAVEKICTINTDGDLLNPICYPLVIMGNIAALQERFTACPEERADAEALAGLMEWREAAEPASTVGSMTPTSEGWEVDLQDTCPNDEFVGNDLGELFDTLCDRKGYEVVHESSNPFFPCADGHYAALVKCK